MNVVVEHKVTKVQKIVYEDVVKREFTITLDEKEASALMAVVGQVLGPNTGPRGIMDKIYYKLKQENLLELSTEGAVTFL